MKISYQWLQKYFDDPLPAPRQVADALTFHAFELESTEEVEGDSIFDVKVTPNRGHDALSHRGVAKELAAILGRELASDPLAAQQDFSKGSKELEVEVGSPTLCPRYSAAVIKGVRVAASPAWLRMRLESVGQRSINAIVDATNFVMFNTGQPLHAFDAAKLASEGGVRKIVVRAAREGEAVTTLDGETRPLTPFALVIGDGVSGGVLGIAGIKGGESSGVDERTTDIILEAANFEGTSIRKTASALKLRTDASARFEHGLSPFLTAPALQNAVDLILKIAGGEVEGFIDRYPEPPAQRTVSVSTDQANALLGLSLSPEDIEEIFHRFGFAYERADRAFAVSVPFERLDLAIPEDLIEEIGRIHGLANVRSVPLEEQVPAEYNARFYWTDALRELLSARGFSEVYTSSFRSEGEVRLANALASDKQFLRADLRGNIEDALALNTRNAPLFGADAIRIFEIGTVFPDSGEYVSCAIGVKAVSPKMQKQAEKELAETLVAASALLRTDIPEPHGGIAEFNFDALLARLPPPDAYEQRDPTRRVRYAPFSAYPFGLRDIAFWVAPGMEQREAERILRTESGDLLVRYDLFDRFEKDGRTSLAYHLVFQAHDRTLTDAEIGSVMERITSALAERGCEIR